MMMKASIGPTVSEAIVRLHADGSATVLASTVEMGQGARAVLAQIAAEVLAIPFERVAEIRKQAAVPGTIYSLRRIEPGAGGVGLVTQDVVLER